MRITPEAVSDQLATSAVRTVVIYGPRGPHTRRQTVHCPAGNGTVSYERCRSCDRRIGGVMSPLDAHSHVVCRVAGDAPARASMVSEVMSRTVVAVRPELGVDTVLMVLVEYDHGGAPVVDERGRPIGMVSATDLLRERYEVLQEQEEEPEPRTVPRLVGDVMSRGAFTIRDGATVGDALDELLRHNVKRLVVVGDDGGLVGVVTAMDLLRALPAERAQ